MIDTNREKLMYLISVGSEKKKVLINNHVRNMKMWLRQLENQLFYVHCMVDAIVNAAVHSKISIYDLIAAYKDTCFFLDMTVLRLKMILNLKYNEFHANCLSTMRSNDRHFFLFLQSLRTSRIHTRLAANRM